MSHDTTPIACTLDGPAYADRLQWIAQLNANGLLGYTRQPSALDLRYDVAVLERVEELVRKESACCAFLTFTLTHSPGQVQLIIAVPDRARDMADDLLAPFLPSPHHKTSQSTRLRDTPTA